MHKEAFARRTRGRGRRTLATIAAIAAFGTVSTTTSASVPTTTAPADAAAKRATSVYTVPGEEVFLEGVAVQDNTYYVTGHGSGTIYRDVHASSGRPAGRNEVPRACAARGGQCPGMSVPRDVGANSSPVVGCASALP